LNTLIIIKKLSSNEMTYKMRKKEWMKRQKGGETDGEEGSDEGDTEEEEDEEGETEEVEESDEQHQRPKKRQN
jgi:hypothetical protein